ncbi:hypothetical protein PIB30_049651 [Stylosanthes scabra]|uniref:Uncharacterized protein n=1 Tax=Stylosanthes scabra TaxID=79078 RepID=A0ABU6SHV5_9FABA|nr:hypothetical protein [Stylosanthes scabra]
MVSNREDLEIYRPLESWNDSSYIPKIFRPFPGRTDIYPFLAFASVFGEKTVKRYRKTSGSCGSSRNSVTNSKHRYGRPSIRMELRRSHEKALEQPLLEGNKGYPNTEFGRTPSPHGEEARLSKASPPHRHHISRRSSSTPLNNLPSWLTDFPRHPGLPNYTEDLTHDAVEPRQPHELPHHPFGVLPFDLFKGKRERNTSKLGKEEEEQSLCKRTKDSKPPPRSQTAEPERRKEKHESK